MAKKLPSQLRVVSLPAIIRLMAWVRIMASLRGWPSISALMKRPMRSSGGSGAARRMSMWCWM